MTSLPQSGAVKSGIVGSLLWTYSLSLGFYSLFNNSGMLPASLLFAAAMAGVLFLRALSSGIHVPAISAIDAGLAAFLLLSLATTVAALAMGTTLNLNHVFAHFAVMICYYAVPRLAIANSRFGFSSEALVKLLWGAFLVIAITVVVDYALLTRNINMADFLPMEQANKIAGSGVLSRPRGFFVEPTDLALALNAITPIVLIGLYIQERRRAFMVTLLLFITLHMLARSAAGLGGLAAGAGVAAADAVLRWRPGLYLSRALLKYTLFLSVLATAAFVAFQDIITESVMSMIIKIFFLESSGSSVNRYAAWRGTFAVFLDSNNPVTGFGTGYLSANRESSLSWILSVLVENGIVGLALLVGILAIALVQASKIRSAIRYGFQIGLVAVFVHMMTNTSFYYPFFWLLLALVQCDWSGLEARSKPVAARSGAAQALRPV